MEQSSSNQVSDPANNEGKEDSGTKRISDEAKYVDLLIKCLFSPAHPLNNFTQQFLLSNKGFDS
jgi:hypothetical protein